VIGFDPVADKERYYVTETGIVVIEGRRSAVDLATMDV
jgi:hypothetical protein